MDGKPITDGGDVRSTEVRCRIVSETAGEGRFLWKPVLEDNAAQV